MSTAPPVSLELAACPLGCPPGEDAVLTGRDRLQGLPGEFTVVRCRSCELLRTNPRPTPQSIGFYYPDEYGPYRGTLVAGSRGQTRPPWLRRLAALVWRVAETNAEKLPPLPPGRMLEIGCASGRFLDRMARRGWQVEGIEFSPAAGAEAQRAGFSVQVGPMEGALPPRVPHDLVVGWMVLEHLHDPVGALKKIRGWTKAGGWLVLSVPNAACWELRFFREMWYGLHLPNHLWHPAPESLRRVLEAGGWRLDRVFYHRDAKNVIGSIGFWLSDRRILPPLARWMSAYPEHEGRFLFFLLHPITRLLAFLRQTGRMTVWARRLD